MDNREYNTDGFSTSSSSHFIPLARPRLPPSQNSAVVIRQNRRHTRTARPHSIGAGIISNPKLVKGWQYYDNSPNQRNIRKYLSTINIPCEEIDSDDGNSSRVSTSYSSPYRDSYRRGVGVIGADESGGDDYIPGVEVQACVAPDSDVEGDDDDEEEKGSRPYLGIILTIVASSALALASVLATSLTMNYSPASVSLWSFQGLLLPSLLLYLFSLCRVEKMEKDTISIIIEQTTSFKRKCGTAMLIFARGLFGSLGVILRVYSLDSRELMTVPDFTVVMFTAPLFILVAAWCYLKEKMSLVTLLIAGVMFGGVGLMMKPTFTTGKKEDHRDQLVGIGIAVGCMLLEVFSVIILRHIRTVQYALITFIYGIVATVGSLLFCFLLDRELQYPQEVIHWVQSVCVAGLVFIGQNLITLALKYEKAGIFAVVRSWEVPVMVLCQILFLQGTFDILSIIGASLVVLGVVVITFRKWIQTLAKSTRARRWCRCLLV